MSYAQSLRLNAWAIVAVLAAAFARWQLGAHLELSETARAGIALIATVPLAVYLHSIWRWIHGLDELQRRIQMSAVCFAAFGMLLTTLGADLLRSAAVLPKFNFGVEGYFVLTFGLYALGTALANRHYR